MQNSSTANADKLQSVITDDLFPEVQHISDVKQVLEEMQTKGQAFQEWQLRSLILLENMGNNPYLHPDGNPYKEILSFIQQAKIDVVDPDFYIDTIEALIPKPPKPVILAEKEKKKD